MTGWKPDPANPGWYLWEGSDPANERNWTQTAASESPEGFYPDPSNPGWYFTGGDPTATESWWSDETVPPPAQLAPTSCPYWTDEEVAESHSFPLANVKLYWPQIYASLENRGLASPRSCVGAIGTIAKETGTFAPVREAYWLSEAWRAANLTRYYPFYGRGFVQLTWRDGYQRFQDVTGIPAVANPDLLLEPWPAAEALAIYWQDRRIDQMADREDWGEVRQAVYGGYDAEGIGRIQRVANYLLPRARA